MEPIKFEEDIRNKLDKRTLQPSDNAWSKLSDRIDNHQGKKRNKKPMLWIGLAASIVGIMLVISQFFNEVTSVDDIHKTVVNPKVIEENKNNVAVEADITIKKASDNTQVNEEKKIKKLVKRPTLIKTELVKEEITIAQENNVNKLKKEAVSSVEVVPEPLTFEQKKIQAVANQIQSLRDNNSITDDAIEALLLEAQKEIRLNQLYNETTGVVDANLLLQDVEADLDQSFRSKVFEVIKTSYGTVKTAVAHRND
ncbi:hypothetical protein Q4Q39_08570 [Flavivirga amylovorans]|uniref:Anti-sigma factor n=1 Tax=Flavivirga amylovorans TaxID=870486 RepID=A0ABT8X0P7_9FLAO|nr:hypothetical protein [Flavivirga amylovorans]MDO5987447.1 hypothetical protein [Flavivirga amylovorans]